MTKIPIALIYLRLLIAAVLVFLGIMQVAHYVAIAISLITIGLLSDIFDGIIARRLNVSTEKLRRMDSAIDQVFWCGVALSAFLKYPSFFKAHLLQLVVLLVAEGLTYAVSFIKFRREVATHAIASKVWVLVLFATLIEVIVRGDSGFLFGLCFYLGLMTRAEILLILLLLRKWTTDVPSFYHALLLRKGKSIKRNKLFNG